ncbi:MAG: hypothetical protein KDK65_01845 [Chlamydiia bacterium]|nr:hypothetical protein [Chlamydiia bacterium]
MTSHCIDNLCHNASLETIQRLYPFFSKNNWQLVLRTAVLICRVDLVHDLLTRGIADQLTNWNGLPLIFLPFCQTRQYPKEIEFTLAVLMKHETNPPLIYPEGVTLLHHFILLLRSWERRLSWEKISCPPAPDALLLLIEELIPRLLEDANLPSIINSDCWIEGRHQTPLQLATQLPELVQINTIKSNYKQLLINALEDKGALPIPSMEDVINTLRVAYGNTGNG